MSPAQQGCAAPPHAAHWLFWQTTPDAVHSPLPPGPPGQHASPAPPHDVHEPAWQTTLPAVQVMPVQHACALAPQFPHEPLAQVPPMVGHAEPVPTQLPFTQQPPPPQVSPAQQG
jgi:hypothetical protein